MIASPRGWSVVVVIAHGDCLELNFRLLLRFPQASGGVRVICCDAIGELGNAPL